MDLNDLYTYADNCGYHIDCFDLHHVECMSLTSDGEYYIAINPFALTSYAEEKVKLAHEVGHCETHAFYDQHTSPLVRSRCETKAVKWAIKKLIPKDELIEEYKHGTETAYELAEHFGVPVDFMQTAIEFYCNTRLGVGTYEKKF